MGGESEADRPSGACSAGEMGARRSPEPPAGGFGARGASVYGYLLPISRPAPSGRRLLIAAFLLVGLGALLVVLAATAIARWHAATMTVEAKNSLGMIAKDLSGAYEAEVQDPTDPSRVLFHRLCPSSRPVPASTTAIAGKEYRSSPAEWRDDPGWFCMRFERSEPQRYQYQYTNEGDSFVAVARGDLDGDGVLSTFELRGDVTEGRVVIRPWLQETDPYE
ncbi:MAG: hypothetical protein KF782_17510 [Labilithrix sp.]|nr:hypothetical protein [Labilithrix sp.]